MRLPLLLAFIMLIASCSRNAVHDQSNSLRGKWKLTSSAISIGGPATWQDADPNNPSYVEFTASGKIIFSDKSSKTTFDYANFEEGKLSVTSANTSVEYWSTLKENELTLDGGGCIEQCTRKYKKISSATDRISYP